MVSFHHLSSSPVEHDRDPLYSHFFSTLYLVFYAVEMNSSYGTVFDLEYADEVVLLSNNR